MKNILGKCISALGIIIAIGCAGLFVVGVWEISEQQQAGPAAVSMASNDLMGEPNLALFDLTGQQLRNYAAAGFFFGLAITVWGVSINKLGKKEPEMKTLPAKQQ